jgi:hypothetical protein
VTHVYNQDSTLSTANSNQTVTNFTVTGSGTVTVIKGSAGFLANITVAGATNGSYFTIYDNASAASGAVVPPNSNLGDATTYQGPTMEQTGLALQAAAGQGATQYNYGVSTTNGITMLSYGTITGVAVFQ